MQPEARRTEDLKDKGVQVTAGVQTIGQSVRAYLDRGNRLKSTEKAGIRLRYPTNSERMNRALKELRPAAFKVHTLIWKWRGAPARGTLPYFTIRSLEKFCWMTRPTIRKALDELTSKGWIERKRYNKHHKNTLYKLVAIRDVAPLSKSCGNGKQKPTC